MPELTAAELSFMLNLFLTTDNPTAEQERAAYKEVTKLLGDDDA